MKVTKEHTGTNSLDGFNYNIKEAILHAQEAQKYLYIRAGNDIAARETTEILKKIDWAIDLLSAYKQ